MKGPRRYKVKEAARLTGVSVRTLHYYDEIGLLVPSDRTQSGYRLYDENDLLRLQQILIGRSLGLALEQIRLSLDDPSFDHEESLRRQKVLLNERLGETHKMISAIEAALASLDEVGTNLDHATLFGGFDPRTYEEEAMQRWGDTDAYRESTRRTKTYSDTDWTAMKSELDLIWTDGAKAMQEGSSPESRMALEVVERHRRHVCRWFYDLDQAMHTSLAEMWVADARFRANIDKHRDGLTDWLAKSVRAAADAG